MIDGGLYYTIYLVIITLFTILLSNQYSSYPDSRLNTHHSSSNIIPLGLTFFLIFFIGLRPLHSSFVDMWNYTATYELLSNSDYQYNPDATNLIFDNLFLYLATNSYNISLFFLLMAIIYFGGILLASRKLFPKDTLYAIIIYLAAFSTFSYATNGIKAGAAASIFLCALGYFNKKFLCPLLLLISLGFHHSMILPICAFIICYFYKKPKFYMIFWFLSLLISFAHITFFQTLFEGFADEKGAAYLSVDGNEEGTFYTGFRADFVLYSAFPIIIGYWAIFKQKYSSTFYNILFCTYLLTNAIWMLCMYANFTNRISYLSWLMLPFVLVYPFFDKSFVVNQYKKLNVVVWAHLGFTIMMEVVYYGFIK